MKVTCSVLLVIALMLCIQSPAMAQSAGSSNASSASGDQGNKLSPAALDRITREVRHELLLLPYYGVFDNLAYQVQPDGTVILQGSTVRPTTKSDAENAVKRIEGVEKVVNNIDVLPTSPNDDQIRRVRDQDAVADPGLRLVVLAALHHLDDVPHGVPSVCSGSRLL